MTVYGRPPVNVEYLTTRYFVSAPVCPSRTNKARSFVRRSCGVRVAAWFSFPLIAG